MSSGSHIIKVRETREIPIDKIKSGIIQVRTKNPEINLESLAKSLDRFGLLNPITVYETLDNYFELLAGQRRLNAAKALNWKTIRATIIEKPNSEILSKAISFIENELREKMVRKDVMNACQEFYFKYGNIKTVSEELGLPYGLVKDSILLPRAPKEVQDAVKKGEIDLKIAMRATDALKWDSGDIENGEKVLELARRIQDEQMPVNAIKAIVQEGQVNPSRDIDEIIKKSRNRKKIRIAIDLLVDEYEKLQEYASNENMSKDEAAASLVIKGLTDEGYLQNENN